MRLKLKLLIIVLLPAQFTYAQGCLESLLKAQQQLDAGNAEACLSLVQTCLDGNESESAKWQAYRLKSIAHLLLQQGDSAKLAAENMLSVHPTYQPTNRTDPQEFIRMLEGIVVIPRFSLGLAVSAGTNLSKAQVQTPYLLADYHKSYYRMSGLQFGTDIGMSINPNVAIQLGILSTVKKFGIDYTLTNWEVSIEEKQTYLDVPLNVKYIFIPKRKLRPYLLGGVFGGYLLYSQASFNSLYMPENKSYALNNLDIIEKRNQLNYGFNVGGGLNYKLNKGHLSFQANYFRSMLNVNKSETRFDSDEQMFTYFYVDDDFRVNNFALSIGGVYYLNYMVYRKKDR